jgi:hypothetical protein
VLYNRLKSIINEVFISPGHNLLLFLCRNLSVYFLKIKKVIKMSLYEKVAGLFRDDEAQMAAGNLAIGAMMSLILIGILGYVGITIMDGVESGIETTDNSTFNESMNSLTGGIETGFDFISVLIIVTLATAVIGGVFAMLQFMR